MTQATNTCVWTLTVDYYRLSETQKVADCSRKWPTQVWCCHFMLASEGWLGIYISHWEQTKVIFFLKKMPAYRALNPQTWTASSVPICDLRGLLDAVDNFKWKDRCATSQFRGDTRGRTIKHTHTQKRTHPNTCTLWAEAETAAWRMADYSFPSSRSLTRGQMCPLWAIIRILFRRSHFNTCNH